MKLNLVEWLAFISFCLVLALGSVLTFSSKEFKQRQGSLMSFKDVLRKQSEVAFGDVTSACI